MNEMKNLSIIVYGLHYMRLKYIYDLKYKCMEIFNILTYVILCYCIL